MHRNHPSDFSSTLHFQNPPLGTACFQNFIDQNQTRQRLTAPVGEITHMPLNTRTSCAYVSRLAPLHGSDNPSTRARTSLRFHANQYAHPDAPKPIHPDKEHFCSRQLSWEQTSNSPPSQTFTGIERQRIETRLSL